MSDYKEQMKMLDLQKTEELLQDLPAVCTEFYHERNVRLLPKTQWNYATKIQVFFRFLHESFEPFSTKEITEFSAPDLQLINATHIAAFTSYILTGKSNPNNDGLKDLSGKYQLKPNKRTTVDTYLSCLSAYFKFWQKKHYIADNPIEAIEASLSAKQRKIIYLHDDDRKNVLRVSQTGVGLSERQQKAWDKNALREMAITLLLLDTGIRVSELVGLDVGDVDIKNCCLKIQRKGDKADLVYFSDTTRGMLIDYLEHRPAMLTDDRQTALFVTSIGPYKGERLGVRSVEKMIKKYAKAAGVLEADKITPHKLRSTYAMNMLEATGNLSTVQQQLGHRSINSTVLYAKSSDKEKEVHRNDLY